MNINHVERDRCDDPDLQRMLKSALEIEARADQETVSPSAIAKELAIIIGLTGPDYEKEDELEKFVALLNRFRIVCGRPSLRELRQLSEQVRESYGKRYPKLPAVLSLATLSDVLNRRRKNPPAWSWVALYVLSCQRFAAEAGLRHDPGDATLPIWNLRLQVVLQTDVRPPSHEEIFDVVSTPEPNAPERPGVP